MKTISIDLETYSDVDLQKCGVYKYAQSENFEILLFGYSVDGGEVSVVDIAQGEIIPDEIIKALADERVIKWAFNASFERVCLSEYLRKLRWSSIFLTFTLKKIIDWNISFQTVSCIHLMNVDVYDCNSHIHNPTCFHLTLDLFQTDSVV